MTSAFFAKNVYGFQMSPREFIAIVNVLHARRPLNLLVFGLGRDSPLWLLLNSNGKTIFLEDNAVWIAECLRYAPLLDVRKVHYPTNRSEWQSLLRSEKLNDFFLEEDILQSKWDVVIVDAPEGWSDEKPGRMLSIFWGIKLLSEGGNIFIHDCDREVEWRYTDEYCGTLDHKTQIEKLRHYIKPVPFGPNTL